MSRISTHADAARHEPDADCEAAQEQETTGRMTRHAPLIYRDTM